MRHPAGETTTSCWTRRVIRGIMRMIEDDLHLSGHIMPAAIDRHPDVVDGAAREWPGPTCAAWLAPTSVAARDRRVIPLDCYLDALVPVTHIGQLWMRVSHRCR